MTDCTTIDASWLRAERPLPEPTDDGSKHDRGNVVVIGGAASTPGAVWLAAIAALRVGAGRLSIATVAGTAASLAVATPEAAVTSLPATDGGSLGRDAAEPAAQLLDDADAILLGPGMTGPDSAGEFLDELLPRIPAGAVVVLDALALTCGVVNRERLGAIADRVIITPNTTEAGWLLDSDSAGDRPEAETARTLADRLGVVTILGSSVAEPHGDCWRTPSGNSGLATSGSGDVLAGAVTGLAARGAAPVTAALWAVTTHSGAGDRLARTVAPLGFLARELLDELPRTLYGFPSG